METIICEPVVGTLVHPLDWDSPEKLKLLLEGALFASHEPLAARDLLGLFPENARPELKDIELILKMLQLEYQNKAIDLHLGSRGYRFQVRSTATALIRSMLTDKPPKYSRASLETLALIAYRQPITRGEIEEIRGVGVSSQIMRTMEERGWIRVVGHKELPGRPALWATTPEFLDYFGLSSLENLPALAEIQDLNKHDDVSQNARIEEKDEILIQSVANFEETPVVKPIHAEQETIQHSETSQKEDYQGLFERLRRNKQNHTH